MTCEVAIIVLKEMKKDMYKDNSIGANALDLAIEALQKTVPMKPKKFESVPHARCPKCNNAIKIFFDAHEYHYCLYCGQRIDWSDENDLY